MPYLRDDFSAHDGDKVLHIETDNKAELFATSRGRSWKVQFDKYGRTTDWYFDKAACEEAAEFFTRLALLAGGSR